MERTIKRIKGFLTRDDVELLEEASTRKPKYKKATVHSWSCNACNYKWFYKSSKCPICSSHSVKELVNSSS